jgi:hypothetical protein
VRGRSEDLGQYILSPSVQDHANKELRKKILFILLQESDRRIQGPRLTYIVVYYESMKRKANIKPYMSVGVMEDYKLRDLRASHTLGWSWNWKKTHYQA